MKTYAVKASDIEREWFVVDAAGRNLGRLATRIAVVLRGKHKPMYSASMDVGDFVVVVNADKIAVSSLAGSLRRAGYLAELAWGRLQQGKTDDLDALSPLYAPGGASMQTAPAVTPTPGRDGDE